MWLEMIYLFHSKSHSANNIRLGPRRYAHKSQTEFVSWKNPWYSRGDKSGRVTPLIESRVC